MTTRLYYTDSFLYDFRSRVVEANDREDASHRLRPAVILEQTAFYPTGGGQPFDTGTLDTEGKGPVRVIEVGEDEAGSVLHFLEDRPEWVQAGATVRGLIDPGRRRDHMQQHSGQHVLSAAFVRLFEMPTVSFHMGEEICTIDLDTRVLQPKQLAEASRLANEVVMEDRPVSVCFAYVNEARARGVRKLPAVSREKLRLVDVHDFDLTACSGTHVRTTGQIGPILLRKVENVKQGVRVEFVCGARALATARHDFEALSEAAGVFSGHIWQVAELARCSQEEAKAAAKSQQKLSEEVAELTARDWLRDLGPDGGRRIISRVIDDRDLTFTKTLAQRIAANGGVALLASTAVAPTLVFAQPAGAKANLGEIMKQLVAQAGGRGGGSKDFSQGGIPDAPSAEEMLKQAERMVRNGA